MGVSDRVPGFIYMYTYWEDQLINKNNFETKELYIQACEKMITEVNIRNCSFYDFLKEAGVPQAPYDKNMLGTIIEFYKRQTISCDQLIIYLVLDNQHYCIRKGESTLFHSNDEFLQSIGLKEKVLNVKMKYN
jgi:hypothetical protein